MTENVCLWCEAPAIFYKETEYEVEFICKECGHYILPKKETWRG